MWDEFHFLRPYWFIALLPLAGFLWWWIKANLFSSDWKHVCDPNLLPYVLIGKTERKKYTEITLVGIVAFVMITALAGPTWQRLPQPVFQKISSLVIVLDLSLSMFSDDIKPSRLEHARFKISDLLDLRKASQSALIVYAGDAFTVTPLTNDMETIKSQLSVLSPDIMPVPGSDVETAITHAIKLLKQAGVRNGDILLISDEVDEKYADSFRRAYNEGHRVSILGIGTKEGAPIKLNQGGFLDDPNGNIIIPRLNELTLRQLAAIGHGLYTTSRIDDSDIKKMSRLFNSALDNNKKETQFETDRWSEFGPWLLLCILPIVAFGFRRGLLSLVICLSITRTDDSIALDWDSLWLNKNQRAMQILNDGRTDAAATLFEDKAWKAAAKYQAGDYPAVEALLADAVDERSLYNKANALAKQGRYQEAISEYDSVLKINPEHKDARYNQDLVKKALEKQQAQSDQNSQSQENRQSNTSKKEQSSDIAQKQNKGQALKNDSSSQRTQQTAQNSGKQQPSQVDEQLTVQSNQQEKQRPQQPLNEIDPDGRSLFQTQQDQTGELDEAQQASKQWLRRIPDDPSGLLRRKFKYQYQQRPYRQRMDSKYW